MALAEDGSEKYEKVGLYRKWEILPVPLITFGQKKYCTHSRSDKLRQSPNLASKVEPGIVLERQQENWKSRSK